MIRLAEILDTHWDDYVHEGGRYIPPHIYKAANQIMACRTPKLGTDVYRCPKCDQTKFVYHSCKNRFCPRCGQYETDHWAATILSQLPALKHHHVVFTLPAQLRPLAKANPELLYTLLFHTSAEVIKEWFAEKHHTVPGIISVLQTAGSDLHYNPHLHTIVSGGGRKGEQWFELPGNYLANEKYLAKKFRWRFLKALVTAYDHGRLQLPGELARLQARREFMRLVKQLHSVTWVVSVQPPLSDPEKIVRYVGRYTRRACLSEYRIVNFAAGVITFECKDYTLAEDGKPGTKTVSLPYAEFFDRLFQHVPLPSFRMVRYYGLYAHFDLPPLPEEDSRVTPEKLTWRELQIEKTGEDPLICPTCRCELVFWRTEFAGIPFMTTESLPRMLAYADTS
ncbi:MAG: transposase [Chloroflexi bacterium]|nr:transposase [Chloroflexota bacterium]